MMQSKHTAVSANLMQQEDSKGNRHNFFFSDVKARPQCAEKGKKRNQ